MTDGCKGCYRRERRRLGLCLLCDRRVTVRANGMAASHCEKHLRPGPPPRKPKPVKKHVLTLRDFREVKKLLAAASPMKNEIAKRFGVSRRTIDRVASGEYDSYFKGMALRNAARLG